MLVFGCWRLELLERPEGLTWDWRVRQIARFSSSRDDIVIIALDQSSLDWMQREQGLVWPWPREVYAAVVDFCAEARSASLTLDVLYSEPSSYGSEDDARLGSAIARHGRVTLPFILGRETGSHDHWPEWAARSLLSLTQPPPPAWPQGRRATFTIPEIAAQAVLGNAQG
ncbi:MAG: CHASE2 domain-containing protein, partial [Candidatus Adiutrix sp.]|nr:CHASE2 domain-containing protein [Candidatus Adiutrix sp.]